MNLKGILTKTLHKVNERKKQYALNITEFDSLQNNIQTNIAEEK